MKGVLTGLSTLKGCQERGCRIKPTDLSDLMEYFSFLETGARELCLSIGSFLIVIYSPFHENMTP